MTRTGSIISTCKVNIIFHPKISKNIRKATFSGVNLIASHSNNSRFEVLDDPGNNACFIQYWSDTLRSKSPQGFGRQILATDFLNNMKEQFVQREGVRDFNLAVTDVDLGHNGPDGGYVYAWSDPGYSAFILSVRRLLPKSEQDFWSRVDNWIYPGKKFPYISAEHTLGLVTRLVAHELGHLLGVAVGRSGGRGYLQANHCAGESGPCLMRQEGDFDHTVLHQHIEELDARQDLCPECIADLNS